MDTNKFKTQSSLNISDEVIRAIVKNSINDIEGVYSLSVLPNKPASLFTTKASAISVRYTADSVVLSLAVIISINYKIKAVCEQVQQTVKDAVQNMAGATVSKVNVFVTGVNVSNAI